MARIGKFVVTGELGRGARTVVHGALDPDIGRQVAVKLIRKSELDPREADAVLDRFRQQVQTAGSLNHPHIVAVYEYGEDEASAWVVMELVGRSLREHLAEGYRPAPGELPEFLVQVLEALDYAHSRGVVHGDLRPASVLISERGAAKLADFGGSSARNQRGDLQAAAALVQEVLGSEAPPAVRAVLDKARAMRPEERRGSVRELLEALRSASRAKAIGANLGALRRGLKAADAATDAAVTPRRLPAVLFVDDEERVLNALAALFEGSYEVHTASSGAAALEQMAQKRFLVLVSDERMPGMTGAELLQQARALAPATVRILLTGYADSPAVLASVNESEVFRVVPKPWDQEQLKATLTEAIDVAIALEAAQAHRTPPPRT